MEEVNKMYFSIQNGTQDLLPPKQLYCIMGCNYAVSRYLQILKGQCIFPSKVHLQDICTEYSFIYCLV